MLLQTNSQEHLRVLLDCKLTFHDSFNIVFTKVIWTIGLSCKLNDILPRAALVTICEAFIPSHLY